MIVQMRIDERLVHGQVAAAWAKAIDITHILCASDEAVNDTLRTKLLLMTAPAGKKVFVRSVDDSIRLLSDSRAENMKVFLITDNPKDALKLAQNLSIKEINVANYHNKKEPETTKLTEVCVAGKEDINALKALVGSSSHVFTQLLPSIPPVDFKECLKKEKRGD